MKLNKREKVYERKVAWVWRQFSKEQKQLVREAIDGNEFRMTNPNCCLIGIPFPDYNNGLFGRVTGRKYNKREEGIAMDVYHATIGNTNGEFDTASQIIKAYVKKH